MCGIAGALDLRERGRVEASVVEAMTEVLTHRGPDSSGLYVEAEGASGGGRNVALGARRLSIVDLATGDQPIRNEDGSVVLVCNGEIFNYPAVRRRLEERGHTFRTRTDIEAIVHLYEEHGESLVDHLNGQFAFALWDTARRRLLLARDPFGVAPLYFSVTDGLFVFGSEIKALLVHPAVERRVDLVGLDQVLSLPGLVSPRTVFAGVESLPAGHALSLEGGEVRKWRYWDLDYPVENGSGNGTEARSEPEPAAEQEYVEELAEIFERSVARRLQADVPVGVFVSGGLDSSLVAASAVGQAPGEVRDSFSITFDDPGMDEGPFQELMVRALGSRHHPIRFDSADIADRLRRMVRHAECPVRESYNTCALALAEEARGAGVKVVLAGEGADELFGGYPQYRFDAMRDRSGGGAPSLDDLFEEELREKVWGDRELGYEGDLYPLRELKEALYGPDVRGRVDEVDCLAHPLVDTGKLRGRHPLHKRSYLDFKLRLADHLLSDHGDRMVMAHSVEARYPFLDLEVVDFARRLPPAMKLRGMTEKYVVRRMADGRVPQRIVDRQKFGFRAFGSASLLAEAPDWVADLLAPATVRRVGVFDPEAVDRLVARFRRADEDIHPHLETDVLMIVLTFHLLCDTFDLRGAA